MTAEIAILNKSAVALASDSAVTISSGNGEEKIFLTSDKLFELSRKNALGVMIYNTMQFMQVPLDLLINEFRKKCPTFNTVEEAAENFLNHLNKWGVKAPERVRDEAINSVVKPVLKAIEFRILRKVKELLREGTNEDTREKLSAVYKDVVEQFENVFDSQDDANFIGGKPRIVKARKVKIRAIVVNSISLPDSLIDRVVEICKKAILKSPLSESRTGIVIAGFGETELFPTLVSYEIDGVLFGKLKFEKTNFVDIDRNSEHARVLPFAQKEMVERFLYGVDAEIEENIKTFVKNTVPEIKNGMLDRLKMTQADKDLLNKSATAAEAAFLKNLSDKSFAEIRNRSRVDIETMVEFMPKPELANMAEALVNLTSIKRKVSRGMETVGGPIDVAIISRNDGFVWVKRKHYFSTEFNPRYSARVHNESRFMEGKKDG